MSVAYFDTSALVKLVVAEAETDALLAWLRAPSDPPVFASSTLTRVELTRAARRHGDEAASVVEDVLGGLDLITMTPEVLRDAADLAPRAPRTLDAIHLATARQVGASLSAFVAYDARLIEAATTLGLPVATPA